MGWGLRSSCLQPGQTQDIHKHLSLCGTLSVVGCPCLSVGTVAGPVLKQPRARALVGPLKYNAGERVGIGGGMELEGHSPFPADYTLCFLGFPGIALGSGSWLLVKPSSLK